MNGKKLYKSVYADTYLEVKKKRLKVLQEKTTPQNSTKPILRELASEWLSNVQFNIKESSYTRYHRNISIYLTIF